ncbi:MAG: MFS transporter [bacterium]
MDNSNVKKVLVYRWLIFLLLALAYFFVYFHRFALSVVAADIDKAFSPSASLMGILGSVYFYCYAFMQFPAGLISDSLGPRKGVTFFLVIASLGSILFGLATFFWIAVIGRILVGLGVSLVFISTMKILSQWFKAKEFAFMAAVLNAVGGLGILTSTAPLAFMTGFLGWRFSFVIIGFLTFVIALLAWFIVKDKPADKGWPSIEKMENRPEAVNPQPISLSLWEGARRVITEKYFWPVAIWFFFDCGIFFGFGALWSGPYLMHVYGMSQAKAGIILTMLAVGMIGGSPIISLLSDRFLPSKKKLLMLSSAGLFADILFLNIMPKGLSRFVLLVVFLMLSLCSSAIVFVAFTTVKELFPVEIAGTSVGTLNLFPFLGGAVFQPLLGRVLDAYPKSGTSGYPLRAYSAMMLVLLAASVISLLCTFFMKETSPYALSHKH